MFIKHACLGLAITLCAASLVRAQLSIKYVDPQPLNGASLAVVVEDVPLVHTAQLLPISPDGQVQQPGDVVGQTLAVLERLGKVLQEAGSGLNHLVRLHVCLRDQADVAPVQLELARIFSTTVKPALTLVISNLPHKEALVAIDAVAAAPNTNYTVVEFVGNAAVLPSGPRVFVSGQAEQGDLATATRGTLQSLDRTLDALQLNKSHIVQLKAFVTPVTDHQTVSQEVRKFFGNRPAPPLVLVEWKSSLPIEIELVAADRRTGDAANRPAVEYFTPPHLKPSPIFCRATRVNAPRTIYTSGLTGGTGTTGEAQVRQIFAELERLTQQTGSDLLHLAKATYYVSDDVTSQQLNQIRPQFYDPMRPPAASKAMVRGVGPEGLGIAIDMIAAPAAK